MAFHRSQEERVDRFVAKVDCHGGNIHHCWPWLGAKTHPGPKTNGGYGLYGLNRKIVYAHRLAWEIWRGQIPNGISVLHICDNPPCCNPHHLFLGTDKDNTDDKVRKGRAGASKGEDHYRARLTFDQVEEIRLKYSLGNTSYKKLAREYGVFWTTIGSAVRRETWRA